MSAYVKQERHLVVGLSTVLKRAGVKQSAVAKKIGVSNSKLTSWKKLDVKVTMSDITKLALALNVTTKELITGRVFGKPPKFVVISFNIDGIQLHGPFDDDEEARDWAIGYYDEGSFHIVGLNAIQDWD